MTRLFLFLGMTTLLWWSAAQAAEKAGQVILARGDVVAKAAGGASRSLRRRSPVFSGETIVTGKDGRAQIRLTDGTLLALQEDTRFRIEDYHRDPQGEGKDERNFSRLLKGGFRTLTGAISKRNPDAYAVETPVATIGVRGTHYQAVLEEGLVVGVYAGGIEVANRAGRMVLGQGGDFRFARIAAADKPPAGLLQPPPALDGMPPPPPKSRAERESGSGKRRPPAAGRPGAPTRQPPLGTEAPPPPPSLIVPVDDVTQVPVLDRRFQPVEWQRLLDERIFGISVGEQLPWRRIDGGRAIEDPNGRPVLTSTGKWPFDPRVADDPIAHVLRRGEATAQGVDAFPVEPGYVIHWGMWNGAATPGKPVIDQVDPRNPDIIEPVDQRIFWATALPTLPDALALRSDTVRFNRVLGVIGGGSGGPLFPASVTRFGATVNFATGDISQGVLDIDRTDIWHVEFAGKIRGSFADLKVLPPSTVNQGNPVKGAIGGVFTGSRGDVLLGGFQFEDATNPDRHVEGLIQAAPPP